MKILAVEDNPADAEMIRELLPCGQVSSSGLVGAGTLAAARAILACGGIDFILLDLGLPDSQGIETLRAVRGWYPALPIVVLTGFDDDEAGMLALREGAQDYLVKGQITGPSLVRSIRYAFERNRIEQELIRKNLDLDAMNEALAATDEELRRNLDEPRREEQDLRKSEEHLARSQEIAHLGSWEFDLPNDHLTWSDEVFRIFGLEPQEFGATYEAFLAAVHPDDRAAVDAAYSGSVREGRDTYEIEHRVVRKHTGEIRYVHEKCDHIRDDTGRIVRSVGMVHDITRRRQMEAENIRAREEWERTFNTVPDLIALIGTNYRIMRVNKAMADRFGRTPEACIGLVCHEVVHNALVPPEFCPHNLTCRDGREHVAEVHEDQLGGDFIVSTTPLRNESGILTGSVHVARDITDRKRAEEELRQKNEDLNTANEELGAIHDELLRANDDLLGNNIRLNALNQELAAAQDELEQHVDALSRSERDLKRSEAELKDALAEKEVLLSEIHHRVKNNLAAFISLLSLEGTYDESPAGRLKKDLQNRARSMALIHETLYRTRKFSTVDMGVYLETLVDQVAGSYHPERPVCTIVTADGVSLDLNRSTPCGLIVNELITNALKYAFPASFDCESVRGEPCTLRVSLTLDKGYYLLTVADNGVGLPRELNPLTAKSLGLKLVNFLAKHQLRAAVRVNTDRGTEFSIRFAERTSR